MVKLESVNALLFDLDGTLIDSAEDLARSGNWLRAEHGLVPLPHERIAAFIGDGVEALVSRLLETGEGAVVQAAIPLFKRHYGDHCLDHTRPYEGCLPVLDALKRRGYRMAVVTNKPERLSRRMLEGLGMTPFFGAVVGGDTLAQKKPDPAPLRLALSLIGAEAAQAAMVGDSRVDVEAGRGLGLPCLAFTGRIGDERLLREARPDRLLKDFAELLEVFQGR